MVSIMKCVREPLPLWYHIERREGALLPFLAPPPPPPLHDVSSCCSRMCHAVMENYIARVHVTGGNSFVVLLDFIHHFGCCLYPRLLLQCYNCGTDV